jgi:hypothetical protein
MKPGYRCSGSTIASRLAQNPIVNFRLGQDLPCTYLFNFPLRDPSTRTQQALKRTAGLAKMGIRAGHGIWFDLLAMFSPSLFCLNVHLISILTLLRHHPSQGGLESLLLNDETKDGKKMATEIKMELARLHMYDYERNAQMPKCTLVP